MFVLSVNIKKQPKMSDENISDIINKAKICFFIIIRDSLLHLLHIYSPSSLCKIAEKYEILLPQ